MVSFIAAFKPFIKCCGFFRFRQTLRGLNVTLCCAQTRFDLLFIVNGPECISPRASAVLVHWLLIASGVQFLPEFSGFSFRFEAVHSPIGWNKTHQCGRYEHSSPLQNRPHRWDLFGHGRFWLVSIREQRTILHIHFFRLCSIILH